MGLLHKKTKPTIEFIAKIPHLKDVEDIQPLPSNRFLPDWWRSSPWSNDLNTPTPTDRLVRQCPMMPELFSSGYILPMWADTTLYFNSKTQEWRWRCGNSPSPFSIQIFTPEQFTTQTDYKYQNKVATAVFQFINPWKVKTSPGYSIFQLPLFYHSFDDVAIMPGTYDGNVVLTDKLEIGYFTDDKEVFIKKGTPLVQYIPYKKTNIKMLVRDFNEEDNKEETKMKLIKSTTFKNRYYSDNRSRGTDE